jgi:hypothetical protein
VAGCRRRAVTGRAAGAAPPSGRILIATFLGAAVGVLTADRPDQAAGGGLGTIVPVQAKSAEDTADCGGQDAAAGAVDS